MLLLEKIEEVLAGNMRITGNRYDEIEDVVIKMYSKISIKRFPFDCFDICDQLGIKYIPYSSLSEEKKSALCTGSQDGLNALWEISKGQFLFVIYFNDTLSSRRIRFTIMHELGHIILNHTEHSDLAESEANYFAKYALAPPPLVHTLQIQDYLELADRFDISYECAFYCMQKYSKWFQYGAPDYRDNELALISLFTPVIRF